MSKHLYSMADVVKLTGVARHRIVYRLQNGELREPNTLHGRRCFSSSDLRKIENFFQRRDRNEKQ